MDKKIFEQFTNQYSLSKTLRFELKPVGKTLENMKEHFEYNPDLQTFLKDQRIEDAYQLLKPIIDDIHEEFITQSLESDEAKNIDFSGYLESYQAKKDDKGEKKLRGEVGNLYEVGEKQLKGQYPDLKWKRGSSEAKSFNVLMCQDLLEVIKDRNKDNKKVQEALGVFKGFFTYLSGFNQNRENYYKTEGKASQIATRIIDENLPKFCDNSQQFFGFFKVRKGGKKIEFFRKEEYLNAYAYLKDQNKTTQIKDAESKEMIEAYPIIGEIFNIEHFSNCLSQSQIEEYNRKIGHYNLLINLYNQARKSEEDFKKLPQFKTLYKQIGCGKRSSFFFSLKYDFEKDLTDEEKEKTNEIFSVEKTLKSARELGEKYFQEQDNKEDNEIKTIFDFTDWLRNQGEWQGIYWTKQAVNTISNKYFENWHEIKDKLKENKACVSFDKKREEQIKINDAVELAGLFEILNQADRSQGWTKLFFKKAAFEDKKDLVDEQKTQSENLINLLCADIEEKAQKFLDKSDDVSKLEEYKSEESRKQIKEWMDHALAVNRMVKYFSVKESKIKGESINSELANALNNILNIDGADWFKWYDALRNYLTKKPQDDAKKNKLKLNFESYTLAGGWDVNKELANICVILKDKDDKKYLAIMRKDYNRIFEKNWIKGRGENKQIIKNSLFDENGEWLKMEYKQIAAPTGVGGFVRKCFKTAQQYGWQCPNKCLNNEGKIITKNEEARNVLTALIDCYRDFFDKYEKDGFKYKDYNFQFRSSDKYDSLHEFFGDVENQGYKISFVNVSKMELDRLIKEGKIYLFEIKNQDSNHGKKKGHKQNLHTIYWNSVFSENTEKPKLNGKAELFYRPAVPADRMEIVKDKNGNELENKKGEKVLKGFRFSKEKFLFHCSINLNYKAKNYGKPEYALGEVNQHINDNFQNQEIFFLGLDRGEKHLVYYSLIDQNGKIIKQGSFNKINGQDYHQKLDKKEGDRQEARKNWQTIGNIKNLKEGYISQVVHEIVKNVTDKPTFIVLEDLNTGFKRGRQKIEKQVYQKLELALAKKLSFVVDKNAKNGELGFVMNALQLTPPVQNYGDIENRKQVGIMLYTRANYTSQTDPVTGWRKTIYLKKGSEQDIKNQIEENFTEIGFDGQDYFFEYENKNTGKKWRVWSSKNGKSLARCRGKRGQDKNEWIIKEFNIKKILDSIFINVQNKEDISLSSILNDTVELSKVNKELTHSEKEYTVWESLRFAIDLIQQIRNSGDENKGQDDNFLQSPVRDGNGDHFDSRLIGENDGLPIDADANGAYNIARKGIIMSEHIKQWKKNGGQKSKEKGSDLDLFISDAEWDLWLKDKEEWERMLPIFASRKAMEEFRKNSKS